MEGLCLSPFLKIGTTFALSQSDGICPVFSDCEKKTVKIEAISVAQWRSTKAGIQSGPDDLWVLSRFNWFSMPVTEKIINGIFEVTLVSALSGVSVHL